jgi:hypothetical protein
MEAVMEEGAMEEATVDEAGMEAGLESGVREARRERCVRKGCACEPGSAETRACADPAEAWTSAHTAEVHPAASHGMHPASKSAAVHPASEAAAAEASSHTMPATATHASTASTSSSGKGRRYEGKRGGERTRDQVICELVPHRRILRVEATARTPVAEKNNNEEAEIISVNLR